MSPCYTAKKFCVQPVYSFVLATSLNKVLLFLLSLLALVFRLFELFDDVDYLSTSLKLLCIFGLSSFDSQT